MWPIWINNLITLVYVCISYFNNKIYNKIKRLSYKIRWFGGKGCESGQLESFGKMALAYSTTWFSFVERSPCQKVWSEWSHLAEKCFCMVERFNFIGGFGIRVEEIGSKGKYLRKFVIFSCGCLLLQIERLRSWVRFVLEMGKSGIGRGCGEGCCLYGMRVYLSNYWCFWMIWYQIPREIVGGRDRKVEVCSQ